MARGRGRQRRGISNNRLLMSGAGLIMPGRRSAASFGAKRSPRAGGRTGPVRSARR